MLTKEVSQNFTNNALTSVHASRRKSLFETSWALTKDAKLTIASLGQNKDGKAHVKHKIKSVDRLVGNTKLHQEIPKIYEDFFKAYVASINELYILVDWSGCCGHEYHMLRASIIFEGRSITIYNEIHPQKKVGNRYVHNSFLGKLKKIISCKKKVVIVTDAGFMTPWFAQVLKIGWDYIGRLPGNLMMKNSEGEWLKVSDIKCKRKNHVKYIGKVALGKKLIAPIPGNVYSYHAKTKMRKDKGKFPDQNKRYALANRLPWVIATSLNKKKHSGCFIKNKYANRMQIEQNFRDEKSPRFGFGWRFSKTMCPKRMAVLILVSHIAQFFILAIGVMAEKIGLHRRFQVNTRKKRVLSYLSLAKQILKHGIPTDLEKSFKMCIRAFLSNMKNELLC